MSRRETNPTDLPDFAAQGLRFECTRCGACCRGRGTVEVSHADIERIAEHLSIHANDARRDYTRPIRKGKLRLADQRYGDCIFFDEARGCAVYEARPDQCRSYPFWPAPLQSRETWSEEASACEGIDRGPVLGPEEIQRIRTR
jgi:Fe-S-cluster containining protein